MLCIHRQSLITSKDAEEQKLHLKQILQRFTKYGILLNHSKCEFGMHELTFLGHRLNSSGVRPLEEKVSAIRDFPSHLLNANYTNSWD